LFTFFIQLYIFQLIENVNALVPQVSLNSDNVQIENILG